MFNSTAFFALIHEIFLREKKVYKFSYIMNFETIFESTKMKTPLQVFFCEFSRESNFVVMEVKVTTKCLTGVDRV